MDKLIDIMKKDFAEFHNTGKIERANIFAHGTGLHVNHNDYPAFFFGDLKAKFVLVHLYPKQDADNSEHTNSSKFKDFDDYIYFHQNYGKIQYGAYSNKRSYPKFDAKQTEFIKPFKVIDLNDDDIFANFERVIDDKLQLELIPFGIDNFETKKMVLKIVKPYMDLVLETISSQPREYVIFCGSIFEKLLTPYIVEKQDYSFKLMKKDGSIAKSSANFSKVVLDYKDKRITAGIAHSFAQQSLLGSIMNQYGQQCFELYNR